MRYLYKINSAYDKFIPARIPDRMLEHKRLQLGWERYIDTVERGDEVWVYFRGPHSFADGVYAKGTVDEVQADRGFVFIRVTRYSTTEPLTDQAVSARVAQAVGTRFKQVFLFPEIWGTAANCSVSTNGASCVARRCDTCDTWAGLQTIGNEARPPDDLGSGYEGFIAGFWVIPRRCYLIQRGIAISPRVKLTSENFYRFKTGQRHFAFPFALTLSTRLRERTYPDFDGAVPIPLSPDKQERGELDRTFTLAEEIAGLFDIPVMRLLRLSAPISKTRMLSAGNDQQQFAEAYYAKLAVEQRARKPRKLLVVDDVATHGTTLKCAARRLKENFPDCELWAAAAGQMILRNAVQEDSSLRA